MIDWQMTDIHGISPVLCMHGIFMEEVHKSIVQPQSRLNLVIKDMVRKEVIRWFDAGIVYSISDSKWVSPGHCVSKKGCMMVKKKKKMS